MRLGFDAKRLFNNFTGLGNYSRFVVNALSRHYPENKYWLYTPKIKSHPEMKSFMDADKFTVRQPERGLQSTFSSVWRSYSLGKVAAKDGVQIFHGLSNELPVTKPKSLKTVVTVHDLIFKRFPQYYNPLDVAIYSWKLSRACKSADLIVAVSYQTANDLKEYLKVDERKLRVIHQGCHEIFKSKPGSEQLQKVKSKYNLPDQFILNVGTIEERKNAESLIKALPLVRDDVPVVFVGRATTYVGKVRKVIDEKKLHDRVKFIHDAAFIDLPAIYQQASLFVYPSVFEGFGIPILEAITSGLPVVTSRGSSLDEAGGPKSKYVNPSNPEEFALAINEILSNESLRMEMISRSKQYISRFESNVIAELLVKIYSEII